MLRENEYANVNFYFLLSFILYLNIFFYYFINSSIFYMTQQLFIWVNQSIMNIIYNMFTNFILHY